MWGAISAFETVKQKIKINIKVSTIYWRSVGTIFWMNLSRELSEAWKKLG